MNPVIARHALGCYVRDGAMVHSATRWRCHLAAFPGLDARSVETVWGLIRRYEAEGGGGSVGRGFGS